jgi:hypothetical protein
LAEWLWLSSLAGRRGAADEGGILMMWVFLYGTGEGVCNVCLQSVLILLGAVPDTALKGSEPFPLGSSVLC